MFVIHGDDAPSTTAPDPASGNLLAVVSGISYALMLCGLRWLGRDGDAGGRGIAAVILGNVIACVATLPFALPLGAHPIQAWGVILYLGVFQIAGAYVLVTTGIRTVPALEVSLLLLVETACNPIWSWWLVHEVPSGYAIAGGGLIIGATVLQALRPARAVPALEPT